MDDKNRIDPISDIIFDMGLTIAEKINELRLLESREMAKDRPNEALVSNIWRSRLAYWQGAHDMGLHIPDPDFALAKLRGES